ncbi:MAG: hypothetical protein J0M17_06905 [Planctomycetes bacterium]|nr:hypothetical protein [Planctomycetota bacterium]
MNPTRSAMVVFSTGPDRELFFDDVRRRSALERGIETILARIQGIRLVTKSDFACTATVVGSSDAIADLKALMQAEALGSVETDVYEKPAFRAAGSRR